MTFVRIFYLLILSAVSGCSTIRALEADSEGSVRGEVSEGDRILVVTSDNRQLELTVVGLSDDGITGEDADERSVTIPYDQISELRIREFSLGRTVGVTIGATIGAMLAVAILIVESDF